SSSTAPNTAATSATAPSRAERAPMEANITTVRTWLTCRQQRITHAIAEIDGQSFRADAWKKEPGEKLQGEGVTMILEQGQVFERAGVGFSHVRGPQLPPSATQHRPELV